jgi:hypothetical protein
VSRLRSWWAYWRSAAGMAGPCGIVALAVAGWLYGIGVHERAAERDALRAQVEAAAPALAERSTPLTAAEPPQPFPARFPSIGTLQDWIERIDSAAAAAGVTLQRADYRSASEALPGLRRYQVMLPVKGSYAQVRAFVGALLDGIPAAALTDMELKREGIAANGIEARLVFVIFLRGGER